MYCQVLKIKYLIEFLNIPLACSGNPKRPKVKRSVN